MKYFKFYLFVLIFILHATSFSGAVISQFKATAGYNRVELQWVVTAENGLKGYHILRSLNGTNYDKIGFVKAKGVEGGESIYKYEDTTVFKSSGRSYYYKIQFYNQDETVTNYEKVITVSPQISSTRHTWGSIKAMFR